MTPEQTTGQESLASSPKTYVLIVIRPMGQKTKAEFGQPLLKIKAPRRSPA
jgi:hypothetical protein